MAGFRRSWTWLRGPRFTRCGSSWFSLSWRRCCSAAQYVRSSPELVFAYWRFTVCLCVCTPFSVWRGGSFRMLRESWAVSLFSFVIIASSVQGLEQCRKILYSFAAATIFIESLALLMGRVQQGRVALLGGTLGNANDLAMMMLMGVPFCLFVIRT